MGALIIEVTEDNFESEVLNSPVPVAIDFYADWCGPCKQMTSVFESVAEQLQGHVKFGRVDTKEQKGLRIKFCVASLPTVSVVRDGMFINVADGLMPAADIVERIERVLTGELDEVLARPLLG